MYLLKNTETQFIALLLWTLFVSHIQTKSIEIEEPKTDQLEDIKIDSLNHEKDAEFDPKVDHKEKDISDETKTVEFQSKLHYPEIGFEERPNYIPNNVVVFTFDDGPALNTIKVLDVLKAKQANATFFINVHNWSNLNNNAPMQEVVRRMTREGHELGSHSANHKRMPKLTANQIELELSSVENIVQNVIGLQSERMTLFRSPYGEPYQGNDANDPSREYQLIGPMVARHAVHIGWNVDSKDYICTDDPECVLENVKGLLQTPGHGSYGIILMHCVQPQTADALPDIIDYIRQNGFVIWTTEDVVKARFGMSSAQIVDHYNDIHEPEENPEEHIDVPIDEINKPEDNVHIPEEDINLPEDVDKPEENIDKPEESINTPEENNNKPEDNANEPEEITTCSAPTYQLDVIYKSGDRVSNKGSIYRCREWPYSGWCGSGSMYAPGDSHYWSQAWILEGKCVEMHKSD